MLTIRNIFVILVSITFFGCQTETVEQSEKRFELIPSSQSGITFRNDLKEDITLNIFNYMYFYNGGGVAIGDLNDDKLPDLYFTANQAPNKLYLNKGNFTFEDVSDIAGVAGTDTWSTGVTFVDINEDGLLDIYVCNVGEQVEFNLEERGPIFHGRNHLYINQGNNAEGIPTFVDMAEEYGLDFKGYATQSAFFDYDLDGDLDLYLMNHSVHETGTFGRAEKLRPKEHPAGDKLLRNDGDGKFTEVTREAGIYNTMLGYGLGIVVGDLNMDGYPDVYIGNDFHENDYLYLNQGGSFTEISEQSMNHTSRFSMGVDIGDINNDGFPEIVSLDMLPEDPVIRKASAAEDPFDVYDFKLNFGYSYQYARNNLQLNLGNGKFSEIGLMSGIYATDWSWSALFADYDSDGYRDVFITNGIMRRPNDLDYINFITNSVIQAQIRYETREEDLKLIETMPQIKLPNYMYRNNGHLQFDDMSEEWGFDKISYSNGAAYADLDNDGDLDLVVNNVDDEPMIYRNKTREMAAADSAASNNYIKVRFNGNDKNRFGIGAKVIMNSPHGLLVNEMYPTHGYQSSMDYELIIGLGEMTQIDSMTIVWPDRSFEVIRNQDVNVTLTVDQENASGTFDYNFHPQPHIIFKEGGEPEGVEFEHQENKFVEFNREPLMPNMVSSEGPKITVGDVNGDGRDDFYVGGAKWQRGRLFIQDASGSFSSTNEDVFVADSLAEDVGVSFLDIENDGDLDLFVASGGNEFKPGEVPLRPRLYLNDGKGNFSKDDSRIPEMYLTGSSVEPADFDMDGDMDIFIGARAIPWNYGKVPVSYLLENDGNGYFRDIAGNFEGLSSAGFVKDAMWVNIDDDEYPELALAGEWMPVTFFDNENGQLSRMGAETTGLDDSEGWWNSINAADFDNDGDMDLVYGNLGLNSKLTVSPDEPLTMYVNDFDDNGAIEQILVQYLQGEETLVATKDEITKQLVSVNKKLLKYQDFAKAKVNEVIDQELLDQSTIYQAFEFRTSYIENLGDGKFRMSPLPLETQVAPVQAIINHDFNFDGNNDLLLAGNFYNTNIQMGRYDASYGQYLRGDGNGNFEFVPNRMSGLLITGDVRDLQWMTTSAGDSLIVVGKNKGRLQFLKPN